jgi:putative DNA primase/helicase
MTAPRILRLVVTFRAKKCRNLSSAQHYDQIRFRFYTAWVESRTTVFANGNNLIMVGDVIRRALQCSFDANVERPELRQFKNNPLEAVLANRSRYIAAALTIVRAYLAAGCPGTLPALASFQDWSRLVRSSLVWLGRADPVDTMETARHEDPELDTLRRVVSAWHSAVGTDRPHTAGKLQEIAEKKITSGEYYDYGSNSFAHPELREAFMQVAYRNGGITAGALGRWLGRYRGRIVGKCKIVGQEDTAAKQRVWLLTLANAA